MNDNTILRIKVPAHLYESVKAQLTLNEAKKSGKAFSDWKVVKEKKMTVPKDGMKKMEEGGGYMGTPFDSSEDMAVSMIKKEGEENIVDLVSSIGKFVKDAEASGLNHQEAIAKANAEIKKGFQNLDKKNNESEMKNRTLQELKAAKLKLESRIQEMEGMDTVEEGMLEESPLMTAVQDFIANHGPEALMALIAGAGTTVGTYLSKKEKETGKPQLSKTTRTWGR
jgi:hypothetical protein